MNYSTYRFTLDIHQTRSQVSIPVLFQDTWVQFLINLTDGGKPYTLEGVDRVILYARKKDGTTLTEDCPIIDNKTRIEYKFSEQTASAIGPVDCEFRLYSKEGGLHITTPSFTILVEERVVEDEDLIPSVSNPSAIDRIFVSEAERVDAEAERIAAEAERVAAEAKRAEADALRQDHQAVIAEANRYTDEKAAGKLDIPTGANHLWATDQNGTLGYQTWSQSASGRSLVRRTPYGQVKVSDAVADDDAVPLAQMNEALSDKASGAELVDLASRVASLEQNGGGGGSGSPSYTDSAVAYEKQVPDNALPVAAITEIGGNSIVFKNPINLAVLTALEGQTITVDTNWMTFYISFKEGGKIEYTADGQNDWREVELPFTFRELFPDAELGREYRITAKIEADHWGNDYSDGYIRPSGLDTNDFVLTEDILDRPLVVHPSLYEYLNWSDPETGDEEWWTAMCDTTFSDIELVPEGRENDTPYDAKVTAVTATGVNLLPFTPGEQVLGDVTVTTGEDGVITLNGTCTSSKTITQRIAITPGRWYILRDFAEGVWPASGTRVTIGEGYTGFTRMYTYNNGDLSKAMAKFDKLGSYGQETIPYTISLKSGHTYENCKLRPMLVQGIVAPTEYVPYSAKSYPIPTEVQELPAYGLSAPSTPFYNRIIFRDDRAIYEQRVSADRTPLSPYVETDITEALGWDGFIEVESGGSITFTNQYSDPVPSTIVYQTK